MHGPTALPVELWREILFNVIDLPHALDMVIDTAACYWIQQDLYHDENAYYKTERQRRLLRLVCRLWRDFADENKHRWIIYDSRNASKHARQRGALKAMETIRSATIRSMNGLSRTTVVGKPRRVSFPIASDIELQLFKGLLGHYPHRIKILCLESSIGYQDEIFEALLDNKDNLPSLRSLMLNQPRNCSTPLQTISTTFPKLTGLTMSWYETARNSPEDKIKLLHLENLYLDVPTLEGFKIEGWAMPELLRLVIPLFNITARFADSLNFVKLYGSRLVFLVLNSGVAERLPKAFWTWCPVLTELTGHFSAMEIEGPIPEDHPIKHLIHFPAFSLRREAGVDSSLWHNIEILPFHLKSIIVSIDGGWASYLLRFDSFPRDEVTSYLERLSTACAQRFIRVEDESQRSLDDYLATR